MLVIVHSRIDQAPRQHAILDKRIKIWRFDIRVAQSRNAIGLPLVGTNEQDIQLFRHRFSNLHGRANPLKLGVYNM